MQSRPNERENNDFIKRIIFMHRKKSHEDTIKCEVLTSPLTKYLCEYLTMPPRTTKIKQHKENN